MRTTVKMNHDRLIVPNFDALREIMLKYKQRFNLSDEDVELYYQTDWNKQFQSDLELIQQEIHHLQILSSSNMTNECDLTILRGFCVQICDFFSSLIADIEKLSDLETIQGDIKDVKNGNCTLIDNRYYVTGSIFDDRVYELYDGKFLPVSKSGFWSVNRDEYNRNSIQNQVVDMEDKDEILY